MIAPQDTAQRKAAAMARIDYFFSVLSPFTYLAGTRLEEIAAKHGVDIEYKPFDIIAVFKETGGTPPGQRHEARKAYRLQELARIARHSGMKINLQPQHWPTNPVPASAAIISAQMAGGGDLGKLAHAILRAVWAEDEDIAQDHVIRACLTEAGFPDGIADRDMLSAVEIYEKNTQEAVGRNVFGAPSYIVDHEVFWGQDRLDYLDRHLAEAARGG